VGVPVSAPAGVKLKPGGNAPEVVDHVYGPAPPEDCKAREYPEPTVPLGNGEVVTIESEVLIVIESACVAVREPASVT
jgi:hypothetical protein